MIAAVGPPQSDGWHPDKELHPSLVSVTSTSAVLSMCCQRATAAAG
jgi:hypothetical protein